MPNHPAATRIVVTGASGLLGRATLRRLVQDAPGQVMGLAYRRATDRLIQADLTDPRSIDALFADWQPTIVVHCAAERRPDVSEKDPAATTRLNVNATSLLAEACHRWGAWLVYVSTDYVFDGSQPPYQPSDSPCPLNHYGATKLAGEAAIRGILPAALILRVPILFGQIESLDESTVTTIAKAVISKQPQTLDHWAIRYPTYTDDVAAVIAQCLDRKAAYPDFSGTYHWSGNEAFTKYEMALSIAQAWQRDTSHLSPDPRQPAGAPRPRNCQLATDALEQLRIGSRTPFRLAIAAALNPFRP